MAKVKKTKQTAKTTKKVQRKRGKTLPRMTARQVEGLTVLHTDLARMFESSFSTFWMSVVDTNFQSLEVTTFGSFREQLESPGCCYTFCTAPLTGKAVLSYSGVTYAAVDRRMGGNGGAQNVSRHLTALERNVLSSLVVKHISDLEASWEHFPRLAYKYPISLKF